MRIRVDDRGLAYADGVFETLAVQGGTLRLLDFHMERLGQACVRLGFDGADTGRITRELIDIAAITRRPATLKLILTRGPGPRGYTPSTQSRPTRIAGLLPRPRPPARHYQHGIIAGLSQVPLPVSPATAGLKTLARTEQVLAAAERQERGWDEALMCDAEGWLICGTMSNVFIVRDQELLTPCIDRSGVAGVMRRLVLAEARAARLTIREERLRPGEALDEADECFVTNALLGIRPVARLGRRRWRQGPVTRMLMLRLLDQGIIECSAGC